MGSDFSQASGSDFRQALSSDFLVLLALNSGFTNSQVFDWEGDVSM